MDDAIQVKMNDILKSTCDAECVTSQCTSYCASLINNERVRNRFHLIHDVAEKNKKILLQRLEARGSGTYQGRHACDKCNLAADNFSLYGAIQLGLEVTAVSIKYYKRLLDLSESSEDKELFKKMLREKVKQRHFLIIEEDYDHEHKRSTIDYYCIPEIIAQLWK